MLKININEMGVSIMYPEDLQGRESALSERKKMILRAIIDAHIEHGEPVGSKYLMQQKNIAFSSATIRNEMAELETMGFLEQPHTSAGRVPTELGYRFYVDSLIDKYRTTKMEASHLKALLNDKITELDRILETASRLASSMTNYTALAVKPKHSAPKIVRFETVFLSPRSFLVAMIFETEIVKTRTIKVGFDVPPEIVTHLGHILNHHLCGVDAEEITLPLIMRMEREMPGWEALVNPIVKAVYETMSQMDGGELKFEGVNRLLEYPEYYDIGNVKNLFEMFDRKDDLLDMLSQADDDEINVYIGSENAVDAMSNSSLVFKTVKSGGRVIGAIGIIGPRRMDYSRVIETLEQISGSISEIMDGGKSLPPGPPGEA